MKQLIEYLKNLPRIYYYLAGGGLGVGLIIALSTSFMIHMTSHAEFCGSCHAMQPVKMAYDEDIHGGNNPFGFRAKCADCHLPHDGTIHYLWVKQISGLRDTLEAIFKDSSKTDWKKKSERRAEFVYDSGCLQCHTRLTDSPKMAKWKREIHQRYFKYKDNNENFRCVNCHQHVGHKNLLKHTKEFFQKK